jgi:plastocyanin
MRKAAIGILITIIAATAVSVSYLLRIKHTSEEGNNAGLPPDLNWPPPGGDSFFPPDYESASGHKPSLVEVDMKNFAFSPKEFEIPRGSVINWINEDAESHTVTSDGNGPLESQLLGQYQSYNFTFDTAGIFSYHCDRHPLMVGKVTVVE